MMPELAAVVALVLASSATLATMARLLGVLDMHIVCRNRLHLALLRLGSNLNLQEGCLELCLLCA